MSRHVVRLAAAALAVAAVGVVVQPPAQAATCGSAAGVSVVVDFHQLGGGVQTFCDAGGSGEYAAAQFADAGYSLTYVQRQPGFVCRVDGTPAGDPCVNTPPADAYWSLWWSDGTSGTWKYSSSGVASLKVPAGGYVALSWQQGSAKATPGVAPKAHASPSPSPTSHPTSHPTSSPTSTPPKTPAPNPTAGPVSASTSAPSPTGSSSSQASGRHTHGTRKSAASAPHSKATDDASPAAKGAEAALPTTEAGGPLDPTAGSPDDGGLPGWVAPAAVLLLFAAAGAVVVVRRRGSGGA